MRGQGASIEMSASDLAQFLGCRHRTALDMAVAHGLRNAPHWVDPVVEILQQRGFQHEKDYVEDLRARGLRVEDLREGGAADAVGAMREGTDVIVQPTLRMDPWFGRPDILRRVAKPSALGGWSYEAVDTKLARETHGGTILQLTMYSDFIARIQEVRPDRFHVVTPGPEGPALRSFRLDDYAAYFRLIRRRLEQTAVRPPEAVADEHYPDPVEHCDVCRWWSHCDRRRRADDHLCLVAGISRTQIRELRDHDVNSLEGLARVPLPIPFRPRRGAPDSYRRVREQARVQLAGRESGAPVVETLPIDPDHGLTRLPAPSRGDLFLDLEGDPFAGVTGREYLFGLAWTDAAGAVRYEGAWALASEEEERRAFQRTMRTILDAWKHDPAMHVYHFTAYEPAAFKRLMGRYGLMEAEIDAMLRAGLFVDLHAIAKHSIRASVEGYALKELEPIYGFTRAVELARARVALRVVESAIELRSEATAELVTEDQIRCVEGYNREDCVSTMRLRDWLEGVRDELVRGGVAVARPALGDGAPPEKVDERAQRIEELRAALVDGIPEARLERDPDQQARWLIAHMLDWHRREDKASWWEMFRLADLAEEEMFDERAALAGLAYVGPVASPAGSRSRSRSEIHRYTFPAQECSIRAGDDLKLPDVTPLGTVAAIDLAARTVDIRTNLERAALRPTSVFAYAKVPSTPLPESLESSARSLLSGAREADARFPAGLALLRGDPPRLAGGTPFAPRDDEDPLAFAVRIAPALDRAVLPIQGPPGAGKSYTGAHMICALVRAGLKVGVTAVSHRVVQNLLETVARESATGGREITCARKVSEPGHDPGPVREMKDYKAILSGIGSGEVGVAGGTAWMWAREEFAGAVDVLFVDEAGQMSLANVVAVSAAAPSIVLLGDTQQLEQPIQGSHPDGTDVSALQHILGEHQTIPAERGIFLPETRRLHPDICAFTSEVFYEGRLRAHEGLERQRLAEAAPFDGAGLWVVPVTHDGNQTSSAEEGEAVARIIDLLLADRARWIDASGVARSMSASDVLVVAPYNAHVALLEERLSGRGVRVGTVDRFQGQEAPVVIYSMATSTPEDAPRGMEFLYSGSRLNVATSRARCAAILVASPRLFEPECRTPLQMKLANALCRYVELARSVEINAPRSRKKRSR